MSGNSWPGTVLPATDSELTHSSYLSQGLLFGVEKASVGAEIEHNGKAHLSGIIPLARSRDYSLEERRGKIHSLNCSL